MIPCSTKRVGDGIFMVIIRQIFVCCHWLRHLFLGSMLKPRHFILYPDLKKRSIFPDVKQYVFAAISHLITHNDEMNSGCCYIHKNKKQKSSSHNAS